MRVNGRRFSMKIPKFKVRLNRSYSKSVTWKIQLINSDLVILNHKNCLCRNSDSTLKASKRSIVKELNKSRVGVETISNTKNFFQDIISSKAKGNGAFSPKANQAIFNFLVENQHLIQSISQKTIFLYFFPKVQVSMIT